MKAYMIWRYHVDYNCSKYDDETLEYEEGVFLCEESVKERMAELNEPELQRQRDEHEEKRQTAHARKYINAHKARHRKLPTQYHTPLVVPPLPPDPDFEPVLHTTNDDDNGYYGYEPVKVTL